MQECTPLMSNNEKESLWEAKTKPYAIWIKKMDYLFPYFDDDEWDDESEPLYQYPIGGRTLEIPAM